MGAFEDSYRSQLQGVSQQIPRERLDGQVTAQDNMLSDVVTNLRRRPGASFAYAISIPNATSDSLLAWDTDIGGVTVQVLLNTVDGVVRVLSEAYAVLATLPASAYLSTTDFTNIQAASVGDEFFILNRAVRPALGAGTSTLTPDRRGFFYIRAGAFSKQYSVTIKTAAGQYTATYTTPNGTGASDASLSTPEYITSQLISAINSSGGAAATTNAVDGAYAYLETTSSGFVVSSNSGTSYVVTSGQSYLRLAADLPARLPASANGYILKVGDFTAPQYYQYNSGSLAWLEAGDFASPLSITNVPVSVALVSGTWTLKANVFEGRLAGDDTTNPAPDFIAKGVTGISSYQGRLVLLAGSIVDLSASDNPLRFYRSTVTSILDSDTISIGSSAGTSSAYRYAVPYNRDLVLFSAKYQAVMAGGQAAVTPRTASVDITSKYDSDMTSTPILTGRSLMYSAPRSSDFFGLLEMLPSSLTESEYTSYDSTAHLPKYMAGRCRFSVSSSVANMVVFAPTGDRQSLIVHEYTWEGDKKVQQAWHKWTFRYPVAATYFAGETLHVLFCKNGMVVGCTIDPRAGSLTSTADYRAFLDMASYGTVVNNVVAFPSWLSTFDPTALGSLALSVANGPMAGSPVGYTVVAGAIKTFVSFPAGKVSIGFPYKSAWSPTPPMMKDANGVKISANKLTILRFMLGTNNSSEYDVSVSDRTTPEITTDDVGPLYFSSSELVLGDALVGADSTAIIPARTEADSTNLVVSTSGTGELNVVALEYVARYHEKIKRLQKG